MPTPLAEPTSTIYVRVPESDRAYLEHAASREGMTLSGYVRRLIRHHVSNPGRIG